MRQYGGTIIRILIADDSEAIVTLMSRSLNSSPGIEVVGSASNGAEAVARSDELVPDLVILDVEMPIMDGLEATRRIKEAHPSIVVILVGGSANLLTASVSAGADGYIAKPFSTDSLICRVIDDFNRSATRRSIQPPQE